MAIFDLSVKMTVEKRVAIRQLPLKFALYTVARLLSFGSLK